jgi:hypothetical protein
MVYAKSLLVLYDSAGRAITVITYSSSKNVSFTGVIRLIPVADTLTVIGYN